MAAATLERYGSQEPTFVLAPASAMPPESVDFSDGRDAVAFAARFGLILDPWQDDLTEMWMARDAETGRWVAGTWGISVPRQNGKNGTLEAVELYMMVVLGLRILHTAHQVKTAQKHFRRMKYFFGEKRNDPLARFPELNALVKEVRSTNGQEAIFLWDPETHEELGAIEISARSKGSARGFTNDVLVIDEAQHLKDEHLEALRPAISAAPSGDPIAIYMGTPPKTATSLDDEGEGVAFMRIRAQAINGTSGRSAWMEFGIKIDLDKMSEDEIRAVAYDRTNWYAVNPALGRRIFEQSLEDELLEMGPRSFCRERLNVWPSESALSSSAFDIDEWIGAAISERDVSPAWVLRGVGLDMDMLGRMWVTMAAGAGEGRIHLELLDDDPLAQGQEMAVKWLWERCRRRIPIVMASDSGATILEAALRAKKMKVYRLSVAEVVQASSGLVKAASDGEVYHLNDPIVEKSILESGRETLSNGLWKFGRHGDLGGAPLYAVACARYGAVKWAGRERTGKSKFG